MAEALIRASGMTRTFKETAAVSELDLDIHPGELFGLVGPDGAGKTTLLRLLAGLLDLSAGQLTVAGHDLRSDAEAVKPLVGYMAQQFSMYAELTVVENLTFFSEINHVPKDRIPGRIRRLLEFADLTAHTDRRASQLSGGMQKKLALACTLIHEPRLLLLDEPTTGVDPISRREFWNILTDLHLQGTTIVVSTPYMDEADRCTRVGLMYRGEMMACAPPHRLREMLEGELLEIRPADWRAAREVLFRLPGVREVQTYGERLHVLVDSTEKRVPEIAAALRSYGLTLEGIRPRSAGMEQTFISLIRRAEEG